MSGRKVARIVLGTTFDFHDLLAYTAGILLILIIDLASKHFSGPQPAPVNTTDKAKLPMKSVGRMRKR